MANQGDKKLTSKGKRSIIRMGNYNQDKEPDWAKQNDQSDRLESLQPRNTGESTSAAGQDDKPKKKRPYYRPRKQKDQQQDQETSEKPEKQEEKQPDYRAKVATQTIDEPLYNVEQFSGMSPVNDSISHDLDFSGFRQLMDSTYRKMAEIDPRVRRRMPFCLFQHYMVEFLNAHIIDLARKNGGRTFLREPEAGKIIGIDVLPIPGPISEYLSLVNNSVISANDRLLVNLPAAGTPQNQIAVPVQLPSGTFGIVNVASHNAYECYWSPYVSRRLIEQTLVANGPGGNFQPWDPFPAAAWPGGQFNGNLLGYSIPERLNAEGLREIAEVNFANSNSIAGGLCHSNAVMTKVAAVLNSLGGKLGMKTGLPKGKLTSGVVGFIESNVNDGSATLSEAGARILSPESLSATNSGRTYI